MPSLQLSFELNNFLWVRSPTSHDQNLPRLDPYHFIHYRCGKRRFDLAYLISI